MDTTNNLPPRSVHPEVGRIQSFSPEEVAAEIDRLNARKAPRPDKITARTPQEFSRNATLQLTYIFNVTLRLEHFPHTWKLAKIIMLPKPGKPPELVESYRPISLLSVVAKLWEKLFQKRLQNVIQRQGLVPNHQFGFQRKYSTINQVHRVTQHITEALERKQFCPAVFLDISQAFDKVWHDGLLFKLYQTLPITYCNILQSYLLDRAFVVKYGTASSATHPILAGVPQDSVLDPTLYVLFTADIPVPTST